ncbi:MAG TPA: response regulator, partial [Pyrinomonadaceae bacterium]|nr:response regulator [Pyrinomonadaceae bacterium]
MSCEDVGVVEDDPKLLETLTRRLERRKFTVYGAGTVAAAHRLIRDRRGQLGVMILDMLLNDPDAPGVTGADVVIQARDQYPDWKPECLIQTEHDDVRNYYRQALRLGAAAYLSKKEHGVEDVIRHVRALALRHSLRFDHPRVMDALASIAQSTTNLSEAVRRFSRELLAGEIESCLATPYALLLSDERGTRNVATNTRLPTAYAPAYAAMQILAHGVSDFSR